MAKAAFAQLGVEDHRRAEGIGHTPGLLAGIAQLGPDLRQIGAVNGASVKVDDVGRVIDDLLAKQRRDTPP